MPDPLDKQTALPTATNSRLSLRLILAFDDDAYERRFVDYYTDFYFRYAQVSLGIGFLLISGDFLADTLAFASVSANRDRVFVVLPIMAALLAYTAIPHAKRHWQRVMAVSVVVVAAAIFRVLHGIDRNGGMGLNSWVGIMNLTFVEFFCFVILGIQFRYALASGIIILLAFLYALAFVFGMDSREVAYWSYHVVTLFILAAGIGWWREFLIRQDFATKTALEEARGAAESLARIKSEFLANMSHEIRTPLNGVLGLAQIGQRDSGAGSARQTFERILYSGRLLLGIVNDVLDFSKIEAGKLRVECVPLAMTAVLEAATEPVAERARAKSLALTIHRAADLPAACRGDPLRLTQILVNLLANAVKFTERGGIELLAALEGDTLVFQVRDTGIGISADQLDHIFIAFEQADSSATRKFGGTGLGLSICRRLAGLMGGEIRVTSRYGHGSTFELRLPYHPATAPSASPATPGAAAAGPRLTGLSILAADDSEVNRFILADILAAEGARVVMVDNGTQAVEQVTSAGRDAFDVVLMDIQMRDMDGLEATRRIRALAPALPVIGQTALVMMDERELSLAAGMCDHIAKPIDVDDLVAKIHRHARRPPATAAMPEAGGAAAGPIDWAAFELKYRERPGYANHVIASVLRSDAALPAKLRAAAAAADMDEMIFLAHAIHNTALLAAADDLRLEAKETELAARAASARATDLALQLASALEQVLACLSRRRGQATSPYPPTEVA